MEVNWKMYFSDVFISFFFSFYFVLLPSSRFFFLLVDFQLNIFSIHSQQNTIDSHCFQCFYSLFQCNSTNICFFYTFFGFWSYSYFSFFIWKLGINYLRFYKFNSLPITFLARKMRKIFQKKNFQKYFGEYSSVSRKIHPLLSLRFLSFYRYLRELFFRELLWKWWKYSL